MIQSKTVFSALAAGIMTLTLAAQPGQAADAAKGKKVYSKCKACHTLTGKHTIGPSLKGVFGRKAGTAPGYKKYSKDLKEAGAKGLVWDEASMDAFVHKPKKYIGEQLGKKKGKIKMAFSGLKKDKQRADLVAYLKEATK